METNPAKIACSNRILFWVRVFLVFSRVAVLLLTIFISALCLFVWYRITVLNEPLYLGEGMGTAVHGTTAQLHLLAFWVAAMGVGAVLLLSISPGRPRKPWRIRDDELIVRRRGLMQVRFDLRRRMYRLQQGLWPFMRVETGSLEKLSSVCVSPEFCTCDDQKYIRYSLDMQLGKHALVLMRLSPSFRNLGVDLCQQLENHASELRSLLQVPETTISAETGAPESGVYMPVSDLPRCLPPKS